METEFMQKYLVAFLFCALGTALWGAPVPPASNETLRMGNLTVERQDWFNSLSKAPEEQTAVAEAYIHAVGAGDIEPEDPSTRETLTVGNQKIVRLKQVSDDKDFLFASILFPKRKREMRVVVISPHNSFAPKLDNDLRKAVVDDLTPVLFTYVEQAWKAWRTAANAWLPQKYKLPALKITLSNGKKPTPLSNRFHLGIHLVSGKYGFYNSISDEPARGAALSFFQKDGNGNARIVFFVENEWVKWLLSLHQSAAEQVKAAEDYKRAAAAVMAGNYYEGGTDNPEYFLKEFSAEAKEYMDILSKSPAETWTKEGVWATYNQQIFTHEMGHLFGLVHIQDEEDSIMAPALDNFMQTAVPSAADGLRLATLACWYYNQRAKKDVCRPLERPEKEEIKEILRQSVYELQKELFAAAGVPTVPAKPITARVEPIVVLPNNPGSAAPAGKSAPAASPVQSQAPAPRAAAPAVKKPIASSSSKQDGRRVKKPVVAATSLVPVKTSTDASAPAVITRITPQGNSSSASAPKPLSTPKPTAAPVEQKTSAGGAVQKPAGKERPAKPVCFICGKEMDEGEYYSFADSKHVHKKSECAYRAFAQYYKTDSASLARYEDFYFLHVPKDVVQARETLRSLGLTTADIRRYAAQNEAAAAKHKQALAAADQAARNRAQLEEKCQFYMHVTSADVQRYARENQAVLKKIAQKQQGGRPLSKKESLTQRYYEQLLKNYQLTNECQALKASR